MRVHTGRVFFLNLFWEHEVSFTNMSYEDNTQRAMEMERISVDEFDDSDESEDELMEMISLLLILRKRRKQNDQIKNKKLRRNPRF